MQAAAHRAGSIQLSDVEFTSKIIREKVDAKVREKEKEEADKIAIIAIIIIIMLLYHHHHASCQFFGKVCPDNEPRLTWQPDASDLVAVLDEIGTNISMIGQNDRGRAEMRVIPKAVGGHHYPKCNNHPTDIWQMHDSLLNSHFK